MVEIISYGATWCGPCQDLKPRLQKFVNNNPDVKLSLIDVDTLDPEIVEQKNIKAIPHVNVTHHGRELLVGSSDFRKIIEAVESALRGNRLADNGHS